MGRIDDYFFNDRELNDFKDQIRDLINFGKVATQIVTTAPDWAAQPGERVLLRPVSGGMTEYIYAGSAWTSTWSI